MARDPKAKFVLEAERRGAQAFKSFESDLGKIAKRAALVGAALAGAMVAGLAAVTKAAFDSQDKLAKWSDTVGDSMQNIESFRRQGRLAGIELEKMDTTLFKASRRLAEFNETGAGPAGRWLKRLSLDTQELANLQPTELMQRYAEAIRGLDTRGEQLAATMALMGDESGDLLRVVDQGREAFEAQRDEVDRYGLALSRVDAAKIEAANDAMFNIRERAKGLGNLIAAESAPLFTHLAQGFLDAGADADTMRGIVSRALDVAIAGAGHAANAFYGWQLIISQINITLIALEKRFSLFSRMQETGAQHEREFIALARQSGIEIQSLAEKFDLQTQNIDEASAAAKRHHAELLAAGPPSKRLAATWERVKKEAQAAGEAAAAAVRTPPGFTGGGDGDDQAARELAEREAEQLRQQLEGQLEQVRTFTLTREEIELEAHARRLDILRNAFEQELIEKERFDELSIMVAQRTQDRLNEIAERGADDRQKFAAGAMLSHVQTMLSGFAQLSQIADSGNKRMFALGKAAAIAEALVSTHQAAANALATKAPWPLPLAFAAAAVAAGLARVKAIKSQSFGGGAGAASVGGSVPMSDAPHNIPAPFSQPERGQAQTVVNVTVTGIVGHVDQGTAMQIGEAIRDVIDTNDFEIISPDSGQAAKIRRTG